jgi:CHAT domain
MKGISVPMNPVDQGLYLPITLEPSTMCVRNFDYERSEEASDDILAALTDLALEAFARAEHAVIAGGDIELPEEVYRKIVKMLAQAGSRAFRQLFNEQARAQLDRSIGDLPSGQPAFRPTFISKSVAFPWEVLFDGEDLHPPDPRAFWGLRFAPARVLDISRDNFLHAGEQALPSDMLFCLHEKLREAHEREWPEIAELVRASAEDKFRLLRAAEGEVEVTDGETLLRYLDGSVHNMVHFACHCRRVETGSDALEVSLVDQETGAVGKLITLETWTFTDVSPGKFRTEPLIFLNACRAGGGGDVLRKVFNLPGKFVARGAGAVIATACPVPDRFAAAFAREFYRRFLASDRMTIGEALRLTRRQFMSEYRNPLGLAYGLYTPAHYRLATAPGGDEELF